MTDAQVLAAQAQPSARSKAETLGAQHRRFDNVDAGFQAAVGLQTNLVAQVVATQYLVRLGQAKFPGTARVLDRAKRTCARATIVAGDRNQIGIGLDDAGRDRANTGLGNQLDRHECLRINLLEIEDQLRKIFDRIDVVMRRRRYQANTRLRITQPRDHLVDLVTRQLAAFTRLGALRDLDLDDLRIDEVFRGYAKAPGSDLFDLGHPLGAVARWILAALARVRARADAVHRNRQRLMRLGRQRAQRHAGTVEAPRMSSTGSTSSSGTAGPRASCR